MNVAIELNGKLVGNTTTDKVKIEYEEDSISNGNGFRLLTFTKSKTFYVDAKDVVFTKGFTIDLHIFNSFDFIVKRVELPSGIGKPKKKRIAKKYNKKYTYTYIINNCRIDFI